MAGLLDPPPPQNPGSSSGIEGLFIGGLIISGYLLLAFWEVAVARWVISAGNPRFAAA